VIKLFSPAKVNLFMQVRGKRPDGFHELASLFQAISLGDVLTYSISDQDRLSLDESVPSKISKSTDLMHIRQNIPLDASNLILKAVDQYRKKTGFKFFVDVVLDKRLPMQAGLGGGSSNAATTLFAINKLLNCPLSFNDLVEISKDLGSDITFFFSSATAFCTGRGEVFQNLPPLNIQKDCFIAKPRFGLSTPLVFRNFEKSHRLDINTSSSLNDFYIGKFYFFNDLEQAAFKVEPRLIKVKEALLESGFEHVVMTGSGTAFFCVGRPMNRPNIDITLYPITFISRKNDSWYDFFDYHEL
jgi:4-diphosphocytidyl-2-C-methyl-D-erythritol kinase